MNQNF